MSSIDADTPQMINALTGKGSSLANGGTINVSKKFESRTNKVAPNSSVVGISKVHNGKHNGERLSNRLLTNEPEIKADETEHCKQFDKMFNFVNQWGTSLVGLHMDYKWKPKTLKYSFTFFLMVYTWLNFLYSQYVHIKNGNYGGLLEVFALYGIGFAVIMTMALNYKYYKEITALMYFARKICLENVTGTRATTLKLRLIKIHNINIFFSVSGFFCVSLYGGYPIWAFLIDGELVSIIPIEIMFIDKSTYVGFLVANGLMSVMGLWTVLVLLFVNLCCFTLITNYSIQVDMIGEDIHELNESWSGASVHFKGYQQIFLRNVCQKHQDMTNYIKNIEEIYNEYIFFFFAVSYLSQVICMFEIITKNWISGYGVAFAVFICQMGYCLMGTLINTENDRFLHLLHQLEWYKCDLPSRKMYLQLLTNSVDLKKLWIGGLAPLDLVTAVQIVKSMYTYYTVLMEFA